MTLIKPTDLPVEQLVVNHPIKRAIKLMHPSPNLREEVRGEVLQVRGVHAFAIIPHHEKAPAPAAKLNLYFDRARA